MSLSSTKETVDTANLKNRLGMWKSKTVLGLHGKTGHGKTTFEKMAVEWCQSHNVNCMRIAFADLLKLYCAKLTNQPLIDFYENKDKVFNSGHFLYKSEIVDLLYSNEIIQKLYPDISQLTVQVDKALESVFPDIYRFNDKGERYGVSLCNMSLGLLLQLFGTNIIRKYISEDFWVLNVEKEIIKTSAQLILVTDVRFKNEKSFFDKLKYCYTDLPHDEMMALSKLSKSEPMTSLPLSILFKSEKDNEFKTALFQGIEVLRIERPHLVANSRDPFHASEIDLDDQELYTLENYHTLSELSATVHDLLSSESPITEIQKLQKRKSGFFKPLIPIDIRLCGVNINDFDLSKFPTKPNYEMN